MKVFISGSGFEDLNRIKEYYLEEGASHIGEEFVVSIIERIETLIDNPDIGRMVPEFDEIKIRISSRDLVAVQSRALEEGIPYQTLVSSVIDKYISGSL